MQYDIKLHDFTDEDIRLEEVQKDAVVFHARDSLFPVFQRSDVLAMAKHFKIQPEELQGS